VGLAFWRWSLATIFLLPFAWKQAALDWKTVLVHWKMMLLLSITGTSVFNTLLYVSVQTTTAINAALIQTVMPAVIVIFSLLIFREKIRFGQLIGVAVSMAGAMVVIMRGHVSNVLHLAVVRGDLVMFLAIFFYALYSVFLKKRPAMHPLSFLLYIMAIGSLGLLPIYIWESVGSSAAGLEPTFLFSILYFALFPSLVAYFCWNKGVELIGANRAGLFINLIPVFASLMAVVWLQEALEWFHFAGLLLVFIGMVLFNRLYAYPQTRNDDD
jgi:drug/metabolite transporter (DMT)-like permease